MEAKYLSKYVGIFISSTIMLPDIQTWTKLSGQSVNFE